MDLHLPLERLALRSSHSGWNPHHPLSSPQPFKLHRWLPRGSSLQTEIVELLSPHNHMHQFLKVPYNKSHIYVCEVCTHVVNMCVYVYIHIYVFHI